MEQEEKKWEGFPVGSTVSVLVITDIKTSKPIVGKVVSRRESTMSEWGWFGDTVYTICIPKDGLEAWANFCPGAINPLNSFARTPEGDYLHNYGESQLWPGDNVPRWDERHRSDYQK